MFLPLQQFCSFCAAPEIWFDPASYNVSEDGGFVDVGIRTNRLELIGSALFYTEDDTATG